MPHFGARFGRLVLKYREAQGLGPEELANEALGDGAKRSRIWELENGKVARPQAKTISALQVYLNIPQCEVDACRQDAPSPAEPQSTPAEDAALAHVVSHLSKELKETAREAGIREAAILTLARRISADVDDVDQALRELERAVEIAIEMQSEKGHASNIDRFVDDVIERMADLSAEGRDDEASEAADEAFADWLERQEREKLAAEKLLEQALRTDLLRRDAKKAAKRLFDKAQIAFPDQAERFNGLRNVQEEWYVRGRDQALLLDLQVSAELAALVVRASTNPEDMATAFNDHAIALTTLGERVGGEQGMTWLKQAIDAYDAALDIVTRDTMPAGWADTQMHRAIALSILGERAGGELGMTWLREAIDAYDAALEIRTRDTTPANWAMTQMNRANVLMILGERAGGEQGMAWLRQAVDAYDAAMDIVTRDTMPAQWALTQMNRANALAILGQRASGEQGRIWLKQAVDAYDAALEIRTRDTMPVGWARTQMNRANALLRLGRLVGGEQGGTWLRQAVDAYDAALKIVTHDTMPADWALTQMNRANALLPLGERAGGEQGMTLLKEAVDAYDAALDIFDHPGMEHYAEVARENRAEAVATLERLKGSG